MRNDHDFMCRGPEILPGSPETGKTRRAFHRVAKEAAYLLSMAVLRIDIKREARIVSHTLEVEKARPTVACKKGKKISQS